MSGWSITDAQSERLMGLSWMGCVMWSLVGIDVFLNGMRDIVISLRLIRWSWGRVILQGMMFAWLVDPECQVWSWGMRVWSWNTLPLFQGYKYPHLFFSSPSFFFLSHLPSISSKFHLLPSFFGLWLLNFLPSTHSTLLTSSTFMMSFSHQTYVFQHVCLHFSSYIQIFVYFFCLPSPLPPPHPLAFCLLFCSPVLMILTAFWVPIIIHTLVTLISTPFTAINKGQLAMMRFQVPLD